MSQQKPLTTAEQEKLAPRWTSSQPGDDYMIPAQDLIPARVPGQRVVAITRDDRKPGRKVEVSVPHLPYEKWIDNEGNVRQVAMKTNRVKNKNGASVDSGNYYSQMERHYLNIGWKRYDRTPEGSTPEAWAVDREKLITLRRTDHDAEEAATEVKFAEEAKLKGKIEGMAIAEAMKEGFESFKEGARDRSDRASKRAKLESGE